jgi:hypothetical protein
VAERVIFGVPAERGGRYVVRLLAAEDVVQPTVEVAATVLSEVVVATRAVVAKGVQTVVRLAEVGRVGGIIVPV